MMRVDIDDHELAVFALPRLARRVRERLRCVELLDGQAMHRVRGRQFH
jgi:hypothetical protein